MFLTLNKIMLTFLQTLEAVIFPTVLLKSGLSLSDSLSIYGILTGMAPSGGYFSFCHKHFRFHYVASHHSRCKFRNDVSGIKNNRIFYLVFYDYGNFLCWCFSFYGDFIEQIFQAPLVYEYIMILYLALPLYLYRGMETSVSSAYYEVRCPWASHQDQRVDGQRNDRIPG